ncbi:MAG: aldehyde dehydrogenase family protein [Planctomycetes bacterium]|nr:aldehyde dehydrogenase family protein [Planctomycetota bacterium]
MTIEGKLLIAGEWCDATGAAKYDDINPATEEVIAHIAEATKEDAERAVAAARDAFDNGPWWNKFTAEKRQRLIWKVGELIQENAEELAQLETKDVGKPISETRMIDAPMAADVFRYYAGAATKLEGATIPVKGNFFNYTLVEPLGVVGLIVPWNFPLLILARKVAAALAAGCCVVIKPARETPLTALKLGELCVQAGIPAGVVNVVTGRGSIAGQAIVDSPDVDGVSFTGSTEVGQQLMRSGAGNVKKLSLELGGKSPNIVFADADLDTAVKFAAAAIFYNAGEVCTAGSRLFVEESVKNDFVEKLVARTAKMKFGDPMDEKTRLGPLVSRAHQGTVADYVTIGKNEGATLATGGCRGEGKGFFHEPTIFTDVKQEMRIASEEIFGPVLVTMGFSSIEEVIEKSNCLEYGLASAIWTKDIKKAHALAKKIRAGTVWINTYNMYDAAMPYGGVKMSGHGYDSGMKAFDFYCKHKGVWVDLN